RHGPLRVGGELFDSRGYLERPNSSVSTAEVNALELGQAYLAWDYGGPGDAVAAGRFTMDDGSRRLIARNLFRNTINAFTGVRLDWRGEKDAARLFWTMPQIREPDDAQGIRANRIRWDHESLDQQFFGGSYTHALAGGASVEIYGYGLTERDSPGRPTRNRRLFTTGVWVYRAPRPGRLDYEIEAIYQTGRERRSTRPTDLQDLQVGAYFVHAEIGRRFRAAWSPRLALQYDQASGDDGRPGHYGRFDTLFGARRGEYGPTSLWGAVQRANLRSPGVRLEVRPDRRWDGFAAVRGLWLDSPTDSFAATGVQDPSGRSGRFAGEQAEVRARYWLVPKAVRLEAGTAWLFKGRFLKDAPNAPKDGDSRYAYVDATCRF
ncbi:MAG: alginate export family protein, partial [Alphaproteobacteria bacterium]|nr:alginate export family protein [Alphaproteobacteria bacterium]